MLIPKTDHVLGDPVGRYRLLGELARGGMGIVYVAAAQGPAGFSKLVALKELRPDLVEDGEFLTMFMEEARVAARLNHPNIVQTNDVDAYDGRHFIAMEYLEGRSFYHVLKRFAGRGGFPMRMALSVLRDALAALDYAHEVTGFDGQPLGFVHRDISPHNIFVTFEGHTKVIDFGIAKARDSSLETKTGVLKGRANYMAPEQLLRRADRRSDIFSVGAVLFEILSGRRLWQGMGEIEILAGLTRGEVPSLQTVRPEAAPELIAICERALATNPDQRYATAAEMRDAIDHYLWTSGGAPRHREISDMLLQEFDGERQSRRELLEAALLRLQTGDTGQLATLDPDPRDASLDSRYGGRSYSNGSHSGHSSARRVPGSGNSGVYNTNGGARHSGVYNTDGGARHSGVYNTNGGARHSGVYNTDGGARHSGVYNTDGGARHSGVYNTNGGRPSGVYNHGGQGADNGGLYHGGGGHSGLFANGGYHPGAADDNGRPAPLAPYLEGDGLLALEPLQPMLEPLRVPSGSWWSLLSPRRAWPVLGALAIIVAGAVAVMAIRQPAPLAIGAGGGVALPQAIQSRPVPAPPIRPAVAAPTELPSPHTEEMITLSVGVAPSNAQIYIDGELMPSNPFIGRFVKTGEIHRLRALAPGYRPKERIVSFADNVMVAISLNSVPAPAAPAPAARRLPVRPPLRRPEPVRPTSATSSPGRSPGSSPAALVSPALATEQPSQRNDRNKEIAPRGEWEPPRKRAIDTSNPYDQER
jgi:serine/threonine protein kinase